jgi:hypothetical protein
MIVSDIKRSETPSQGFRAAFLDVLKIVTAFTVRNS